MSIRRKRRQRGKRKVLRREALKTWEALCKPRPAPPTDFPSVIIPMVRRIMPSTIAHELVGVQPMAVPHGMFGDSASGIEPVTVRYSHGNRTKKEISKQRKAQRKEKKRGTPDAIAKRFGLEKARWDKVKVKFDTLG